VLDGHHLQENAGTDRGGERTARTGERGRAEPGEVVSKLPAREGELVTEQLGDVGRSGPCHGDGRRFAHALRRCNARTREAMATSALMTSQLSRCGTPRA